MAKFKIGDKVRIKNGKDIKNFTGGWVSDMGKHIGEVHKIESVNDWYYDDRISYSLDGLCCNWDERCLEKVEEKIVIKRDGNKVIAYSGKKQGIAKCSPSDEFDMYTGAKLALDRLFEDKKPRFEVGDIVIGNTAANVYDITKEGYVGVVTEINGNYITIVGDGGEEFFVCALAFDRVLGKDVLDKIFWKTH